VLNKVTTLQETQIKNQKMGKLTFPEYAEPYIMEKKTEEQINLLSPM
jgi:hypothetical protein